MHFAKGPCRATFKLAVAAPKQSLSPATVTSMSPALRTACLCVLLDLSVAPSAAHADIYRYVDENGTTHFTNMPEHDRYSLYMKTDPEPSQVATTLAESRYRLPKGARRKFHLEVTAAAQTYAVEPALIHAVISAESGYNPLARSPKGARGLMQLMPATAARYGVQNPLDPKQNIQGGAAYLRDLLKLFGNDLKLAIAAYNAGEGAVMQHGFKVPPFRETMDYVPKVLSYYHRYKKSM